MNTLYLSLLALLFGLYFLYAAVMGLPSALAAPLRLVRSKGRHKLADQIYNTCIALFLFFFAVQLFITFNSGD